MPSTQKFLIIKAITARGFFFIHHTVTTQLSLLPQFPLTLFWFFFFTWGFFCQVRFFSSILIASPDLMDLFGSTAANNLISVSSGRIDSVAGWRSVRFLVLWSTSVSSHNSFNLTKTPYEHWQSCLFKNKHVSWVKVHRNLWKASFV